MTNSNFRSSQKIILFQFKRWRDDLISDHISREDIQSYSTYSTVVSYLLLFAIICSTADTKPANLWHGNTWYSATGKHLMPPLSSYIYCILNEFAPSRIQSAAFFCTTGQSLVRQHLVVRHANTSCHRCHHIFWLNLLHPGNRALPFLASQANLWYGNTW